jgi:predicted PhzF superfamily epimerase YddE/YHI9
MQLDFYHVDAFTHDAFAGNPAAVFPLERWPDEPTMLAIAAEMRLPAAAFFVPEGAEFELRWFAPSGELQLCGHATLASGFVLRNVLHQDLQRIAFRTCAGPLEALRDGARTVLDFPALPPHTEHVASIVAEAIGVRPIDLWEADGGRGMAVLESADQVRDLRPSLNAIAALPFSAMIVTARGSENDCDFVSRYFAPQHGISEDFVTGSAHCVLTPYWGRVLSKRQMFARQLSSRGGELWVEDSGHGRVRIAGECVLVGEGTLTLPRGS